ncbi:MAG: glycosyltransferase [Candidatus Accumulibacter sp.]|uniref:glycosyltransferase n=1 Tax=Accumulibacter sp. TaxID=2053492 RepID=UPI0028791AB7|nr:glycosyltransferase [Accumulibacter sp.]MDS4013417.1 glycosyltransferase [Accumulibacter sp.]
MANILLFDLPCSGWDVIDSVLREIAPVCGYSIDEGNTSSDSRPRYLTRPQFDASPLSVTLHCHWRNIVVLRDLREVAISFADHLLQQGEAIGLGRHSLADAIEMVITHNLPKALEALRGLPADPQTIIIRYEDILRDADASIHSLLARCGLTPPRENVESAIRRHLSPWLEAQKRNLRLGWHDHDFDASIHNLFQIFLGDSQALLGYAADEQPNDHLPPKRQLSMFSALRRPYYIWAQDYRQSSAGIRCLHYLCHALNELGEEAYITPAAMTHPSLRTPQLTDGIIRRHFLSGRTPIAIYPEVVAGNPLSVPIIARWLLNRPGHIGGDTHFEPSDLIFHFSNWCLPTGIDDSKLLNLPTLDTAIFNNKENQNDKSRNGLAYYANKYLVAGGRVAPEIAAGALSLGLETPRAANELAEIFRQSVALLCYELSSMIPEALACGCPVLIMPSDYWDRHGDPSILDLKGIALATEAGALERAQGEIAEACYTDDKAESYRWWQIKRLVTQTQQHECTTTSKITMPWCIPRRERLRHLDEINRFYAGKVATEATAEDTSATLPTLTPSIAAIASERLRSERLQSIELIVVATEPVRSLLAATLESLDIQCYPTLAITVVAPPSIIDVAAGNGRRCLPQTENHWLAAREALAASTAEWSGIVRSGDCLAPTALAMFAGRIIDTTAPEVLYSDTADTAVDSQRIQLHLLPDFDIDLVRAGNFPFGLLLARTERWRDAGGWRVAPAGIDTLDAALRLYEQSGAAAIGHVAGAYLVRHRNNQPFLPTNPQIIALRQQIVLEHLVRCGVSGNVMPGLREELVHIRYPVAQPPKVSLIIPTKDNGAGLETCVRAVMEVTDYPNLECLIIDNGTVEPSARAYLDNLAVSAAPNFRVAAFGYPFNPGAVANAAAELASGDLLLFLHDDVEALQPSWIHALVEQCLRPGVGIAGARLLASNGTIAEAGIVPMQMGLADSPFAGLSPDTRVTASRLQSVHQVSAISGACMMVRRDVFQQVGGMDAINFPARGADIDFCLKVRAAGHRILWTPFATLLHDSDGTLRGNKHDGNALLAKWGRRLVEDPTFNPRLALDGKHEALETDPALIPDPLAQPDQPKVFATYANGSAAGHYRLVSPLRAATKAGSVSGHWAEFLPVPVQLARLGTNHLHALTPVTPHQLRELDICKQLIGCSVILELDGLLDASIGTTDQDDPFRRIRSCLRQTEAIVDRYVTGSAWLAVQLPNWTERITVIPDALDPTLWNVDRSERRRGAKLRVGWRGTEEDLEMIAPVVITLADKVDWVFIGDLPEALATCAGERYKAFSAEQYPSKLASLNLDLAIQPLAMTPRNHCASHLPLLEYGYLGIPVIATDIPAHTTGLPVRLTGNDLHNWVEAIVAYVQHPDTCRQDGDILRQHVLERWLMPQQLPAWQQLWQT